MSDAQHVLNVQVTEEHYPGYDAAHGTPDPMTRRLATFRLTGGTAQFEQTDYGHPGRFNDWVPRGIDPALAPRADALKAICEAVAPALG